METNDANFGTRVHDKLSKILNYILTGYETCDAPVLKDIVVQTDILMADLDSKMYEAGIQKYVSEQDVLEYADFWDIIESGDEEFCSVGDDREEEKYHGGVPYAVNIQLKDPPHIIMEDRVHKTRISMTEEYLQQNGLELLIGEGGSEVRLKSGNKEIYPTLKSIPKNINISVIYDRKEDRIGDEKDEFVDSVQGRGKSFRFYSLAADEIKHQELLGAYEKEFQKPFQGLKIASFVSDEEYEKQKNSAEPRNIEEVLNLKTKKPKDYEKVLTGSVDFGQNVIPDKDSDGDRHRVKIVTRTVAVQTEVHIDPKFIPEETAEDSNTEEALIRRSTELRSQPKTPKRSNLPNDKNASAEGPNVDNRTNFINKTDQIPKDSYDDSANELAEIHNDKGSANHLADESSPFKTATRDAMFVNLDSQYSIKTKEGIPDITDISSKEDQNFKPENESYDIDSADEISETGDLKETKADPTIKKPVHKIDQPRDRKKRGEIPESTERINKFDDAQNISMDEKPEIADSKERIVPANVLKPILKKSNPEASLGEKRGEIPDSSNRINKFEEAENLNMDIAEDKPEISDSKERIVPAIVLKPILKKNTPENNLGEKRGEIPGSPVRINKFEGDQNLNKGIGEERLETADSKERTDPSNFLKPILKNTSETDLGEKRGEVPDSSEKIDKFNDAQSISTDEESEVADSKERIVPANFLIPIPKKNTDEANLGERRGEIPDSSDRINKFEEAQNGENADKKFYIEDRREPSVLSSSENLTDKNKKTEARRFDEDGKDEGKILNEKPNTIPDGTPDKLSKVTDTADLEKSEAPVASLSDKRISSPSLLKALEDFEKELSPLKTELSRLHSEFKSIDLSEELRRSLPERSQDPGPPPIPRHFSQPSLEPYRQNYDHLRSFSSQDGSLARRGTYSNERGIPCSCSPGTCIGAHRSSGIECQWLRRLDPHTSSSQFVREFNRTSLDRNSTHYPDSIWSEPDDILGHQSRQPSTSRNGTAENNKNNNKQDKT